MRGWLCWVYGHTFEVEKSKIKSCGCLGEFKSAYTRVEEKCCVEEERYVEEKCRGENARAARAVSAS